MICRDSLFLIRDIPWLKSLKDHVVLVVSIFASAVGYEKYRVTRCKCRIDAR